MVSSENTINTSINMMKNNRDGVKLEKNKKQKGRKSVLTWLCRVGVDGKAHKQF